MEIFFCFQHLEAISIGGSTENVTAVLDTILTCNLFFFSIY